jgi:hypothetical protein
VLAAGVPWNWLTGDTVYGNDWRMRAWLEERRLAYGLGVSAPYRSFTGQERAWAAAVVGRVPDAAWSRLSCGVGSKGERRYDWTRLLLQEGEEGRPRWLIARRSLKEPTDVAYYVGAGPRDTSLERLVQVGGTRWAVEESFETAKGEVGLDHYEVRSWQGWYRHITLALFAQASWTAMRAAAVASAQDAPKKGRTARALSTKRRCCFLCQGPQCAACCGGWGGAACLHGGIRSSGRGGGGTIKLSRSAGTLSGWPLPVFIYNCSTIAACIRMYGIDLKRCRSCRGRLP